MAKVTVAKCRDGHNWLIESQGPTCPSCKANWVTTTYTTEEALRQGYLRSSLSGGPAPNVQTFKPYVEENFGDEPVLVGSKRHRDELCNKHQATYDRCSDIRPPDVAPAIDSIDFGDVKHALEHGVPEEDTELDLPSVEEECD